ncbi:sodium:proton antiporter [uncultured Lactobacillus sp.]|uniref:cation:proton antiporter n=1 Tax=uncultured Lactobacillus sp. TaxID=153152 RepID=UPI0026149AA5|nr:sodium:proton antiporter [uncultured Lactobacillus sp.]
MELMISTFTLAIASALSIIIAQALNRISVNYVSMAVGVIIALIPFLNKQVAAFDSEIFMELIVAPLLFFEGQKTPFHNVRSNLKKIISITVVMIILVLLAAGFGASWVGQVSLPVAFIIASISTPTDATATSAVTSGLKIPRRVNASLKAESLFNDASGIILLNMAILWFTNGYINYGQTIGDFIYSSIGGAVLGLLLGWGIITFRQLLMRSSFNSLNAQNLLYILTPLVIYALAEELNLSGIIAVVVAGLLHNAESQQSILLNSRQIHMGKDLQSLISEVFNSMVFVILGILMVRISRNRLGNHFAWQWILVGITIYLANVIVRFLYSLIALRYDRHEAIVFALGGVHGAVTLSLALTLSGTFLGNDNYNLIIMSEAVLILLSMIVPTIIFQFILPHQITNQDALQTIERIRGEMVKSAIKEIHHMYLPKRVKKYVIYMLLMQKQAIPLRESLRTLLKTINYPEFSSQEQYLYRQAFYRAFAIEREYLEMIGQKEAHYRRYILSLYNDVLLAESLIIEPEENDD